MMKFPLNMTNSNAIAPNSAACVLNSIAKMTNSIEKLCNVMKSFNMNGSNEKWL